MKKISIILLSLFIIVVATVIFHNLQLNNQDTKRKEYEKLLNSKMNEFSENFLQNKNEEKKLDNPQLAAFQNFLMTMDPKLGRVPSERLFEAYKIAKLKNLRDENISWQETQVSMGGRTRCLMFDPNDVSGNKVWAGSVTGGLWYNDDITNENSSWIPVNDFWQSLSVSKIVYDPNDTQIFYMGTGEAETAVVTYRESSGRGVGIYTSNDGGDTWSLLSSTSGFEYITDIAVKNESGTSVIYASVVSGVYQGEVHQSDPNDGLYRSDDGGVTWEQVLPDIPGEDVPYSPADIEIGADGRIYIGTMPNINDEGGAVILYSDNGTSGTWSIYNDYVSIIESDSPYNIPGRIKLTASSSNENVIYAFLAAGSDSQTIQTFRTYRCTYILRSDNKGSTWTEKNHPDGSNGWAYLAWHALIAKVDPNDENTLFIGGLDLYKSSDGGLNWNHISDWAAMYSGGGDDYVHADQHEIVFKSGISSEIIFGTDGGVFYTNTGNLDYPVFQERSLDYNTLQFYTCAIKLVTGSPELIGGLQDNGTVVNYGDYIDVEDMIDGGDGAFCFYDKNEPNLAITSYYNNGYSFFNNYEYINSFNDYSGTFISPADYDYKLNTLYANAVTYSGYYQDKILRISGIPSNLTGDKITLNTSNNVPFSCVRVSPYSAANTTTLFAGTMSGRLFKVVNAHSNPTTVEITGYDFPVAAISSISLGTSENTIIVTFSNYGVESVWASFDGGSIWENKEGDLSDIPVRWSLVHPENNKQVILATELGIWTTLDISATDVNWVQSITGLANVRVDMLDIRESDNTVVAATHGRGLYTAIYDNQYVSIDELKNEKELIIYPNPSTGIFNIKTDQNVNYNYEITNSIGQTILKGRLNEAKNQILNLSNLKKGTYIISVINQDKKVSKIIVLE